MLQIQEVSISFVSETVYLITTMTQVSTIQLDKTSFNYFLKSDLTLSFKCFISWHKWKIAQHYN